FWLRPGSSSFIYSCGPTGPYFEGATSHDELSGYTLLAAGADSVLAWRLSTGSTFDDAGEHGVGVFAMGETLDTLTLNNRWREVRSTAGGFWVVRGANNNELGVCNLYFIDGHTGTASYLNSYTDPGVNTPRSCTGRLDSQGVLYTPGTLNTGAAV